jgi:hypothetical protein
MLRQAWMEAHLSLRHTSTSMVVELSFHELSCPFTCMDVKGGTSSMHGLVGKHAIRLCAISMRPPQQTEASALAVDRRCLSAHMVGLVVVAPPVA